MQRCCVKVSNLHGLLHVKHPVKPAFAYLLTCLMLLTAVGSSACMHACAERAEEPCHQTAADHAHASDVSYDTHGHCHGLSACSDALAFVAAEASTSEEVLPPAHQQAAPLLAPPPPPLDHKRGFGESCHNRPPPFLHTRHQSRALLQVYRC